VTYYFLATIFFVTLLIATAILVFYVLQPKILTGKISKLTKFYILWLVLYGIFILLFTGPTDMKIYPSQEESPYKLPWKSGISRFVAQGNRSFTSHRDFHEYAWDFVMPNGTEILAVRDGRVVEIEDSFDGIGFKSNFIIVEHDDGTKSAFAHIQKHGALTKIGDIVKQGQPIALSGMVGQTIFPHVHFYVIGKDGNSSIPVSFREVPGGVPFAGHIYTSQNDESSKQ
jgi:hypothetical protein